MYRFNNDYNRGMHPAILKKLEEINMEANPGYGLDPWCDKAAALIREACKVPYAHVHFLVGGTQANYTVIASTLRAFESVICADSGHIYVHETGAVEHIGHKIEALPAKDGKITAEQVEEKAIAYETSEVPEHITTPKMVYISFPTEYGTIYSKQELKDLYNVCKKHKLYLFIDGARLGYGLGSPENDLKFSDIAKYSDVFYIGGTKCGAAFGEAVVITNDDIKLHFRSSIKQNGGMLAKGWLLGVQFATLFENNLYLKETKKADTYAMEIKAAFKKAGIKSYIESPTNQQFVVLTNAQAKKLAKNFIYENEGRVDKTHVIVRFCTSWATTREEVDALLGAISKL